MKKKFCALVSLFLAVSCCHMTVLADSNTNSQTNSVIGHIYSTDIVAYIDDIKIPSYNFNGKTVVSEKDLEKCGFKVNWNSETRVFNIDVGEKPKTNPIFKIAKNKTGKILGDVYQSDIKTYLNTLWFSLCVTSYNVGNDNMIPLEELSQNAKDFDSDFSYGKYNKEIGYGDYGFKVIWNAKDRTVKAYSLRKGSQVTTKYGTYPIVDSCNMYYKSTMDTITPLNQSDIHYANLKDVLKYYKITPSWKNNTLSINAIAKKGELYSPMGSFLDRSFSLLPIIEVPVTVSVNPKESVRKFTVRVIVSNGEFYTNADDWKTHIFK